MRDDNPAMDHLDALHIAVLVVAAFAAGAVNAVAGGGSLISFPALLFAGYPAVTANITNAVSLVPGYLGGALAYRRELSGQAARARRLIPVSVIGAVAGAALLVAGPAGVFQRIVPWLILGACVLLALQPWLKAAVTSRRSAVPAVAPAALLVAQTLAAVYGAYFGAGLGVIMLAVMGIYLHDDLQRINALKGALSVVINAVAVAYFLVFASVAWTAVLLMAPISFVGGQAGVLVARRLDERTLRLSVVTFGVVVSLRLLV